jgi:hypothetical protein
MIDGGYSRIAARSPRSSLPKRPWANIT